MKFLTRLFAPISFLLVSVLKSTGAFAQEGGSGSGSVDWAFYFDGLPSSPSTGLNIYWLLIIAISLMLAGWYFLRGKRVAWRRPKFTIIIATITTLLIIASIALSAGIGVTHKTYDVDGKSLQEVGDDIWGENGKGFVDPADGTKYAGKTTLSKSWSYSYSVTPRQDGKFDLTFSNVTATLSATITKPNWKDKAQASEKAQAEWDRFFGRLNVHEQGHVDRYQDHDLDKKDGKHETDLENAIVNAVNGKTVTIDDPAPGETDPQKIDDAFKAAAEAEVEKLIENDQNVKNVQAEIDQEQKKYDDDTNHGATEEATLDVNVK